MNITKRILILCICGAFLLIVLPGYSAENKRQESIDKSLRKIAVMKALRKQIVEKALHRVEGSLEFGFGVQGEQTYVRSMLEYDAAAGTRVPRRRKVEFPHRGQIVRLAGEARIFPNVYVGARYLTDAFSKDQEIKDTVTLLGDSTPYNQFTYKSDPQIQQFDVNMYVRLLTAVHLRNFTDSDITPLYYKMVIAPEEVKLSDFVMDKVSLDMFVGYGYYNGRYDMTDGVQTVSSGVPSSSAVSTTSQFYEVTYKGPRLGLRGEGVFGPFTARVSWAYLWLTTEGEGWWGNPGWSFTQKGDCGRGSEFEIEGLYSFTPNFQAGIGFSYSAYDQAKAEETGYYMGAPYPQGPNGEYRGSSVSEVKSSVYYPFLKARVIW